MSQDYETGVRLEYSDKRPSTTDLSEINHAIAPFRSRLLPLNLRRPPEDIRQLLNRDSLNSAESKRILEHFLLSRDRLLEIVHEAGRTPRVPGGGEMSTHDLTHDITYPQLYVVAPGVDYSRFDRFHVNTAADGTGVDEVLQVLSGGGVRLVQHLPEQGVVTLRIDCIEDETGWVLTYDGTYPHMSSISEGQAGTKVLMQIIGPAQWEMKYEE